MGDPVIDMAPLTVAPDLGRGHGPVLRVQLPDEEVHEHAVMPGSIAAPLVAPHPADPPEPDPLVGPNRPLVRGGRIDRQSVVAAVLEEVAGHRPDRIRSEPVALVLPVEE